MIRPLTCGIHWEPAPSRCSSWSWWSSASTWSSWSAPAGADTTICSTPTAGSQMSGRCTWNSTKYKVKTEPFKNKIKKLTSFNCPGLAAMGQNSHQGPDIGSSHGCPGPWTGCWIPLCGSMGLHRLWRVKVPMWITRFKTLVEWTGCWISLWGSKGVNPHEGSEVWNPHGASKVLVWLLQADTPAGVWIGSTGLSSYGILRVRTPCGLDWNVHMGWIKQPKPSPS